MNTQPTPAPSIPQDHRVSLAVDIGGSFTDVVLMTGAHYHSVKVPTTPHAPEEGVMQGVREILAVTATPFDKLDLFILGTTLATNALIERKGARTALLTTAGFRDSLEIGTESRFAQYDIFLEKPTPLVERRLRLGIPERVNAQGQVLVPLDEQAVVDLVPVLRAEQIESLAICFLHSYVNPAHERRAAEILKEYLPDLWITLSSEVCPEIREYERASTTCANAYVQPSVARALLSLRAGVQAAGMRCPFYLMTSSGAIATLEQGARHPVRLIESGPAGGAILAQQIAEQCGFRRALSFDMGGTTAKICFVDDYRPQLSRSFEFDRKYRFMKGSGLPIRIPVIEMVEIGAGGGSIARIDHLDRIQVGPESAVSDPGPACFGRGGKHPTVTDANCVLGLLDPRRFASGKVHLEPQLAHDAVVRDLGRLMGDEATPGAHAITEIVAENMANAARVHAVELGKAVQDYSMIAFGGAAPLHAARLASKLGIRHVVIPHAASVGSAIGFLWAPVAYQAVRSQHQRLQAMDTDAINTLLHGMHEEALAAVQEAAPTGSRLTVERVAYARYIGQGHEIPIELPEGLLDSDSGEAIRERFEAHYRELYGMAVPNVGLEVMTWTVTVSTVPDTRAGTGGVSAASKASASRLRTMIDTSGEIRPIEVPEYEREDLSPGTRLTGPALVAEDQTTTVIPHTFSAWTDSFGCLHLEHHANLS